MKTKTKVNVRTSSSKNLGMAGANLTKGQDPFVFNKVYCSHLGGSFRSGLSHGFPPLNKGVDPSSHNEGMDRYRLLSRSDRARLQCPSLGEELWQLIRAVESGQVNRSIKMSSCRKDL